MNVNELSEVLLSHSGSTKVKVCVTIHSADMRQNYVAFADTDGVVELEWNSGEVWISATCKSENNNLFEEVKHEPAPPVVRVRHNEDCHDATT